MKTSTFLLLFLLSVVVLYVCYHKFVLTRPVQDVEPPAFVVHNMNIEQQTQPTENLRDPIRVRDTRSKYEQGVTFMRGERADGRAAYAYLLESIEKEHNPEAVLMIAELYRVGIHRSVNPDKVTAARIYQTMIDFASKFPRHIVQTARQRHTETLDMLMRNERDADFHEGAMMLSREFPFDLARTLARFADVSVPLRWERNEALPVLDVRQHVVNNLHGNALYEDAAAALVNLQAGETIEEGAARDPFLVEFVFPPTRPVGVQPQDIREIARVQVQVNNDSQNVHSTTVLNCATKILEGASKHKKVSFEEAQGKVIEAATRTQCDITKIQRVIAQLNGEVHSRFGKSDREIFLSMVAKIQAESNQTKRENLMEVLCHQLESGIENGAVVCSTGRIVRILSVYDGIDGSAQKIIPEWALDQELANMAFRVRELILSKATEAERSAYDSAESNVLAERMNEEFTKEASAAYKDIVSTDTLRLKMNVYREGF
jgi:hypothetical protein